MKESWIATNLAFCFFFKELRTSQYRIAGRVGISPSSMSRVLSFKRPIRDIEVERFCKAFTIRKSVFRTYVSTFAAKQQDLMRIKRAIRSRDILKHTVFEIVRSV